MDLSVRVEAWRMQSTSEYLHFLCPVPPKYDPSSVLSTSWIRLILTYPYLAICSDLKINKPSYNRCMKRNEKLLLEKRYVCIYRCVCIIKKKSHVGMEINGKENVKN